MINFKKLACLALLVASTQFYAQTKIGAITYDMKIPENAEMAAMGSNTMKISFNEKSTATQLDMMGGMIAIKTITLDKSNTKDTRILMDMMGKKFEVTGESEGFGNSDISSLKDAESVTYDKKDTKVILGFTCYKANIKMNTGTTNIFYITEGIASQNKTEDKIKLSGFPLEIEMDTPNGKVTMLATVFDKEPSKTCFTVPEGYKKVTQEELQKEMGGF